jgi:hypothetical protein
MPTAASAVHRACIASNFKPSLSPQPPLPRMSKRPRSSCEHSVGEKRSLSPASLSTAVEAGLSFACNGVFYSPHSSCPPPLCSCRCNRDAPCICEQQYRLRVSFAGSLQRDVSVLLLAHALLSNGSGCHLVWDSCCGCAVRSLRFHVRRHVTPHPAASLPSACCHRPSSRKPSARSTAPPPPTASPPTAALTHAASLPPT